MTRELPDEILFAIFNDMSYTDLLNCLYVCQSWYSPAHIKLLLHVKLTSNLAIQQFNASFDQDQSKPYLDSVKSIHICAKINRNPEKILPERATLEKLFLRFPKLEDVYLDQSVSIKNFDEELCKKILLYCPKLDAFEVMMSYNDQNSYDLLLNVRLLLTNIKWETRAYERWAHGGWTYRHRGSVTTSDDAVRFITQFPLLQSISCDDTVFTPLDTILPILEQLPSVKNIHVHLQHDINKDFAKKFSSAKAEDELKSRLASITVLSLRASRDIVNTLKFVSEYFTGLNRFKMDCHLHQYYSSGDDLDSMCWNTFNVIPTIKSNWSVQLGGMHYMALAGNFRSLMRNMFLKIPSDLIQPNSRVLNLFMTSDLETVNATLDSVQLPFSRSLDITIDRDFGTYRIANGLFRTDVPMEEIDVFKLTFAKDQFYSRTKPISSQNYLALLETMPSLTRVELCVPATFKEKDYQYNQSYTCPVLQHVEEATFKAVECVTMQTLLDDCCSAFPNVKRLNIDDFSGVWKPFIGEFQLYLQDYSLEKLTLDVHPVVMRLNRKKMGFFVLGVENLHSSERRLYRIPQDLSSSKIITDRDLRGFKRREDYLRVSLTVSLLKKVELQASGSKCVIVLDDSK